MQWSSRFGARHSSIFFQHVNVLFENMLNSPYCLSLHESSIFFFFNFLNNMYLNECRVSIKYTDTNRSFILHQNIWRTCKSKWKKYEFMSSIENHFEGHCLGTISFIYTRFLASCTFYVQFLNLNFCYWTVLNKSTQKNKKRFRNEFVGGSCGNGNRINFW